MNDAAKESIDRLFAEPFEPVWAKRQREAEEQARQELAMRRIARENKWRQVLIDKANLQWKLEAQRSHQQIMKNCRGIWHVS